MREEVDFYRPRVLGWGEGEEGFADDGGGGVVDEDCWCAELWEGDLP